MPENSDFSLLADMGAPGERDLPESATTPQFGDELRNALEPTMREPLQKFRDLQSHIVVMNKAAEIPSGPTKQTVKTDPKTGQRTWSGEMPAEAAEAYFRNSQAYQQMLGGYAQQMGQIEQQLRMQEQAIRNQPPWVQLATALAGNMAQAKDMPGWVQGLGRTAAQLNPRPEEIQAKRMAVLGQEAQLAERGIGLGIESARLGLERQRVGLEQARQDRLEKQDVRREISGIYERNMTAATAGKISDPAALYNLFRQAGATEEFAKSSALQLKQVSDDAIVAEMRKNLALDERERMKEAARAAEGEKNRSAMLAAVEKRIEAMGTKAEKAETEKTEKEARQKDFQEFGKVRPKLEGLVSLEANSEKLLRDFESMDKYIGAIKGKKPGWFVAQEEARLRFDLFTQLDAVRRAIQAGARFWNPQEFSNLSPKLVMIDKPQKVNKGIVQATISWIKQERRATVLTSPDVNWFTPQKKVVLGKDADSILQEYRGALKDAGLQTPPEVPSAPGAAPSVERQQFRNKKTGQMEWFRVENNEWVKE